MGKYKNSPKNSTTYRQSVEDAEVTIPQAPDAEKAVLGGLLLNESIPEPIRARLLPSHFFTPSSRKIYEALLALDERGMKLDPVVSSEELRKMGASRWRRYRLKK